MAAKKNSRSARSSKAPMKKVSKAGMRKTKGGVSDIVITKKTDTSSTPLLQ